MRLKKNRAERDRELLDGLKRAPAVFVRLTVSAERFCEALRRAARAAYRLELWEFGAQVDRTCKATMEMTGLSLVYPQEGGGWW